jgi:glycosyltransferase 2 family protein
MRRFIIFVIIILGAVFIYSRFTELEAITETIRRGDHRYLLLAVAAVVAWLAVNGLIYHFLYRGLGLQENTRRLVLLTCAATFMNVVAPSGIGVSGAALFISDGRRNGLSSGKITIAGVLYTLFDYATLLVFLTLGLVVFFRRKNLNVTELAPSAVLVLAISMISILIFLGMRSEQALEKALVWLTRKVNRILRPFLHREYLSEPHAVEFAQEAVEGLQELNQRPGSIVLTGFLFLINKTLQLGVLLIIFMAFKVDFSAGTLIAGYSLSTLFAVVSPTPAGIGVVEGTMPLVLSSLRVPIGAATVVTLAYRGVTFWLPFLLGIPALRLLSRTR